MRAIIQEYTKTLMFDVAVDFTGVTNGVLKLKDGASAVVTGFGDAEIKLQGPSHWTSERVPDTGEMIHVPMGDLSIAAVLTNYGNHSMLSFKGGSNILFVDKTSEEIRLIVSRGNLFFSTLREDSDLLVETQVDLAQKKKELERARTEAVNNATQVRNLSSDLERERSINPVF